MGGCADATHVRYPSLRVRPSPGSACGPHRRDGALTSAVRAVVSRCRRVLAAAWDRGGSRVRVAAGFRCGLIGNKEDVWSLFEKGVPTLDRRDLDAAGLLTRTGHDFGTKPYEPELLLAWNEVIDEHHLRRGAIVIDAPKPPSFVVDEIRHALRTSEGSCKPTIGPQMQEFRAEPRPRETRLSPSKDDPIGTIANVCAAIGVTHGAKFDRVIGTRVIQRYRERFTRVEGESRRGARTERSCLVYTNARSGREQRLACSCDFRSIGPPGLRRTRLANLARKDWKDPALGRHVGCSMSTGGKSPTSFFDKLRCTPSSSIPVTELIGTQTSFLPQRCPSSRSTWVT